MFPPEPLVVAQLGSDWVLFSDGARVVWATTNMLCSCIFAKAQPMPKNCCQHVAYVIRSQLDYIVPGSFVWIPVVLASPQEELKQVSWVHIVIRPDRTLWIDLDSGESACVGIVGETLNRLDARNMVLPHILGLAHRVWCDKCPAGRPAPVINMLEHRDVLEYRNEGLREIIHWLDNRHLCRFHDDSDLVPF
jgi:hypothetical protein